ncbi:trehalose-phosphate phosphatase A [Tanacetum coccineum]
MDGDMSTNLIKKDPLFVDQVVQFDDLLVNRVPQFDAIKAIKLEKGNWRLLKEELIHLYVPSCQTTATYKLEQHPDTADSGSTTSRAPLVQLNDLFIIWEFGSEIAIWVKGVEQFQQALQISPENVAAKHQQLQRPCSLSLSNYDDVLPIYVGDDRTDEDAFKVNLNEKFTTAVKQQQHYPNRTLFVSKMEISMQYFDNAKESFKIIEKTDEATLNEKITNDSPR